MARKSIIYDKLPSSFVIQEVVGPKTATAANSAGSACHILGPPSWVGKKNVWLVVGNLEEKKQEVACARCKGEKDVVYCEKNRIDICKDCCKECPVFNDCPKWSDQL